MSDDSQTVERRTVLKGLAAGAISATGASRALGDNGGGGDSESHDHRAPTCMPQLGPVNLADPDPENVRKLKELNQQTKETDAVSASQADRVWPPDGPGWNAFDNIQPHTVIELEAGGLLPCDGGAWYQEANVWNDYGWDPLKTRTYNEGEPFRVVLFWGDGPTGTSGVSSIGPYSVPPNVSPDGQEGDAYTVLNRNSGSSQNWHTVDAWVTYHELGHTLGYTHADCGIMTGAGSPPTSSSYPETSVMTDMDINSQYNGRYLADSTREVAESCPNITTFNYSNNGGTDLSEVIDEWQEDEVLTKELQWHIDKYRDSPDTDIVFVYSDWTDMIDLKSENTDRNWSAIEDGTPFAGAYVTYFKETGTPVGGIAYPNCPWQLGHPNDSQPYDPDTFESYVDDLAGGFRTIESCDDYPQRSIDLREEADGSCLPAN